MTSASFILVVEYFLENHNKAAEYPKTVAEILVNFEQFFANMSVKC